MNISLLEIANLVKSLATDIQKIQLPFIETIPNGIYIYDTNGKFTLPSNWDTSNNNNAVGVAIIDDNCKFVVAKEDAKSYVKCGGNGTDIANLTNYTFVEATKDFNGVSNTSKIIAAIGNSNDGYRDGSAAGDCAAYTFPEWKNRLFRRCR